MFHKQWTGSLASLPTRWGLVAIKDASVLTLESERSVLFQECHLSASNVYIFAYRCSHEQIRGLAWDFIVWLLLPLQSVLSAI